MRSKPFHLIAATAASLALVAPSASAAAPEATNLERVSSAVQPGIVYMETTYSGYVKTGSGYWLNDGKPLTMTASCSGFFVSPDGHIATAGHCVDKAEGRTMLIEQALTDLLGAPTDDDLRVALATFTVKSADTPARTGVDRSVRAAYGVNYGGLPTGRPLPARVLGFRAFDKGDVALVKIEAENAPTLELAPADTIDIGSSVVSVGYPGKVDLVTDQTFDPSFKDGAISSKKTRGGGLRTVFELSAAVAGGMSGGPTVDLQGRVVGVNSFGADAATEQFNFISPVTEVENLLADEGVENELGDVNAVYREGLAAYYAGDRETAIAKFDEVLGQVYEHEFARQFRAKALRLPAAPKPAPKSGFPAAMAAGIAALVLLIAAATAVLMRRRRRPGSGQATPPQAPRPTRGGGETRLRPNGSVATLHITDGPLAGERIPVGSKLTLGRGHVDVELQDAEVSRRHATIEATAAGCVLTDLDSVNGTTVNGARIDRPMLLVHGDVIAMGQTVIRMDMAGADPRRQATVLRPVQERAVA